MKMHRSATQGLALLVIDTTVPEEPVPAAVASKAPSLTLALGEVARLSVEKPVHSCEIFLLFVYVL